MASNAEWAPQILHFHNDSINSIHSFSSSSSSTLASPPSSPSSSIYKEHSSLINKHETPILSPQPRHWRKTPLKPLPLLNLLFRLVFALLLLFVPSFLRRGRNERKLHPTSYLDGLRGVAALFVFIDHFTLPWFETLKYGYGSSAENYWLLQLPIVRLVYSGRASVGVFFVISGFVLSSKPLSLIHSSKMGELGSVLGSAVLRRGMRLYFPIIVGTGISMVIAGKGWYLNTPTQTATLPPSFETCGEQIQHWLDETTELLIPWREVDLRTPFSPAYNGHLWTIPVEFFGSLVVFVTMLGLSVVKTRWRMAIVGVFAGWALDWGRWDVFLFLGGVFLAELNLLSSLSSQSSSELPFQTPQQTRPRPRISSPTIHILLCPFHSLKPKLNLIALVLSLYLLSFTGDTPPLIYPTYNPDALITPSSDLSTLPTSPEAFTLAEPEAYVPPLPNHGSYYQSLPRLIPAACAGLWNGPEFFILALGSVLLIYTLSQSHVLQRPFTTKLAQYLGDISYSLYIVHGMVVFSFGSHLQMRWTGAYPVGFFPLDPGLGVGEGVGTGAGEGGVGPVRDVLGWGIQGSYGEGLIWNRDLGGLGMSGAMELGGEDSWRYGKAFFVAAVLNSVIVFWAADLFWRGIDRRCVRLARRVEGWLSRK